MLSGRAWTSEELSWAREAATAGESFEHIAAELDRTAVMVQARLGVRRELTRVEAEVASLYLAGCRPFEIDRELGRRGYAHTVMRRVRKAGFDVPVHPTAVRRAMAVISARPAPTHIISKRAECSHRTAQRARARLLTDGTERPAP